MHIDTEAVVAQHYPLALTCSHQTTSESLEKELADDRYYDIVVRRCDICSLPLSSDYASVEDVERLQSGERK